MNPPIQCNTLALLGSQVDAIHLVFHLAFRLIRPTRNKYKLPVNEVVILNACYLYHKYKGSIISMRQLFLFVGYYNKNRLIWYVNDLISKGYIERSDIIKGIEYYRITMGGVEVIDYFNSTYQAQFAKWLQSQKIEL
jgi:hypothetical protein